MTHKYSRTVHLPKCDFANRSNRKLIKEKLLPQTTSELYKWNIEKPLKDGKLSNLFILHDGPPYANGDIHIGHALNKVLKDIILRYELLRGKKVFYRPGWDCHGLPIELKMLERHEREKRKAERRLKGKIAAAERAADQGEAARLRAELTGLRGRHMGPLEIIRESRKHAQATQKKQAESFERLGILGDFAHPYLTLSRGFVVDQLKVFGRLFERGLIHRQEKPVYWSCENATALAEGELEYHEHVSRAAYVKFPVVRLSGALRDWVEKAGDGLRGGREGDKSSEGDLHEKDKLNKHDRDLHEHDKLNKHYKLSEENLSEGNLTHQLEPISALVWTSTPWTLASNRAICINENLRYTLVESDEDGVMIIASSCLDAVRQLKPGLRELGVEFAGRDILGSRYVNPLVGGGADSPTEMPFLHGSHVTAGTGTGLVHTAPGHGQDDYLVCRRHGIAPYSPVDARGRFTADLPGPLRDMAGLKVLTGGNDRMIDRARALGMCFHVDDHYVHSYPYDWRSKKPVVIRATPQWFIDVSQIKARTIDALTGRVKFWPPRGLRRLTSFIANRDEWCISRQRSWGVPIPVLYRRDTGEPLMSSGVIARAAEVIQAEDVDAWFAPEDGAAMARWLPAGFTGDPAQYTKGRDTMDVWFDSGSSWTVVRDYLQREGILDQAVSRGYLADIYLEGSDQHRGWFQSSVLTAVGSWDPEKVERGGLEKSNILGKSNIFDGSPDLQSSTTSTNLEKSTSNSEKSTTSTNSKKSTTSTNSEKSTSTNSENSTSPHTANKLTSSSPPVSSSKITLPTLPYHNVITHGFTLDEKGDKMSKSLGNTIAPAEILDGNKQRGIPALGVDGLRLWVSQSDYSSDVTVGPTVLGHVAENLKKFRFTFRFMLGNLHGFDGSAHRDLAAGPLGGCALDPLGGYALDPLDRYTLSRLQALEQTASRCYREYNFARVVKETNFFVNNVLSALYFDIKKDCLYTDAVDSPRRIATQAVLAEVLRTLVSVLGPILPMLAQEVWTASPAFLTRGAASPFIAGWHPVLTAYRRPDLEADFARILALRDRIRALTDTATRRDRAVRNSLETAAYVTADPEGELFAFLKKYNSYLADYLLVSRFVLNGQPLAHPRYNYRDAHADIAGLGHCSISLVPSDRLKCPRCWKFTRDEGTELCGRCQHVVDRTGHMQVEG